jgi:predicted dehydrogenase
MTLRIGVIGVGGLGHLQTQTYIGMAQVEVVGAADVSEEARHLFENDFSAPAYEHYREFLHEHGEELDAVMIVTPHTLHHEQAKSCMKQGYHVLLEKPMVTDTADAVDLIETADEEGVILQVGYQRHFHPAFEEIRRIIKEGRIGRVHCANCYLGQNWIDLHREDWRTDPSLSGGGQLYDSGSHLLDALLWTTDTKPKSVTAQMEYAKPDVDVNSALSIQLEGEETLIASVGLSGDGIDVAP